LILLQEQFILSRSQP